MTSTRLPGKPLANIGGVPMIVQVWRRAGEAAIGPLVDAGESLEDLEMIHTHGAAANKLQRAHIQVGAQGAVKKDKMDEPLIAAE